jgi:hypothetical protein
MAPDNVGPHIIELNFTDPGDYQTEAAVGFLRHCAAIINPVFPHAEDRES